MGKAEAPPAPAVPRGRPKSGRTWKKPTVKHVAISASDRLLAKPKSKSWAQKQEERAAKARLRERVEAMKEKQRLKKEEAKAKREERERRKAINLYRSTTFQTLSNPEKIKTMNKKQLRRIKKTRIGKHGEVELVSPWAK